MWYLMVVRTFPLCLFFTFLEIPIVASFKFFNLHAAMTRQFILGGQRADCQDEENGRNEKKRKRHALSLGFQHWFVVPFVVVLLACFSLFLTE
jgi:hypothetical protein